MPNPPTHNLNLDPNPNPIPNPHLELNLLLLLLLTLLFAACSPNAAAVSTPLPAHVYLWQRAWTPGVQTAVRDHAPAFSRLVFLARQISWESPEGRVIAIAADWDTLRATGTPVGAAIRIATFPGPFDGPSAALLTRTIRSILAEADAHHVPLAEFQLDFDAATSKLAGYRQWLTAAQAAAGQVPVTITALPTWLDSPAFAPLAQQAGGYVLQVHGLEKPRTLLDPIALCDPAAARAALAKADRLNIPFRLALPTYTYAIAFDVRGQYAGMAAEARPPGWGNGQTIRLAEAQPNQLAALVRELTAAHPAALQGIIWYRLPVDTDRLNWSWTTLAAVMHGQNPAPATLAVELPATTQGLREIQLVNTGQQDADTARRVTVSWRDGSFVAADALAGFQLQRTNNQLQFTGEGGFASRLHPGQHRTIGWLRITQEQDLQAHVD